jgi:predicted site-specific integrase-resolvase
MNGPDLPGSGRSKEEMVQDLMTIVHCFSSRLYGLRNYRKKLNEALKLDVQDAPQV